jgi:PiT family inorganic phosphate transporter
MLHEKYLSKLFTIGLIATVWFVYIQMIPYKEIIKGGKAPRFDNSVF